MTCPLWILDAAGGLCGALSIASAVFGHVCVALILLAVACTIAEYRGRLWMLRNSDRHWSGARFTKDQPMFKP